MDESTSSVDPHNEVAIYDNLLAHFADRTVIASTHRLHLLPRFDRNLAPRTENSSGELTFVALPALSDMDVGELLFLKTYLREKAAGRPGDSSFEKRKD